MRMKHQFSDQSIKNLQSCHTQIQRLFMEVINHIDCKIIEGHRPKRLQDQYYFNGRSKVKYPDSTHNKTPSLGVDSAACPLDWKDKEKFYYFAGIVKGIASMMGIKIRWGGDWDSDHDLHDQSFNDLVHFELIL